MKKVSAITQTGKISDVVMPMIWFQESGYIDGPILSTFYTNLVVLPAVMEYMQYGFIALGLLTILIASLVHHKARVTRVTVLYRRQGSLSGASEKQQIKDSLDHETKEKCFIKNSEN
ncbi:scavenger receptor class B member 1-like [Notolabrus celidotus]|uniref:scavenger receptor class B member 1-like n=1 Tax=Notolabrus celidotus TaxID=1203425 RepID=UPI001490065F|nr:scavenger receptor class B member 1-like [Notolabrus celidotus]